MDYKCNHFMNTLKYCRKEKNQSIFFSKYFNDKQYISDSVKENLVVYICPAICI